MTTRLRLTRRDPGPPATRRRARRAAPVGPGVPPARGLGGSAGQHAARGAPVDPRAGGRRGTTAWADPASSSCGGRGTASSRSPPATWRRSRSGRCSTMRRTAAGRRLRRAAPRPPRRRRGADDLRRGGPRARRAPQQPPVRGGDRDGPHPMGGGARSHVWTCRRPACPRRGPGSSSPAGTCTSTDRRRPRRSPMGRVGPGARRRRSRGSPSLTPVRTPIGDAWILTEDEPSFRADLGLLRRPDCSRAATRTTCSTDRSVTSS